jgi:hypothetical protein
MTVIYIIQINIAFSIAQEMHSLKMKMIKINPSCEWETLDLITNTGNLGNDYRRPNLVNLC